MIKMTCGYTQAARLAPSPPLGCQAGGSSGSARPRRGWGGKVSVGCHRSPVPARVRSVLPGGGGRGPGRAITVAVNAPQVKAKTWPGRRGARGASLRVSPTAGVAPANIPTSAEPLGIGGEVQRGRGWQG